METDVDQFICLWCGTTFQRRYLVGRKPCYCHRSCRQRAYEARRRAALVAAHPQARPAIPRRPRPPHYEAGRRRHIVHALRPDGLPDPFGRRITLCGTYAAGIRPPYGPLYEHGRRHCRTCDRIVGGHPPPRPIDPPRDLAVLTNLARRLQADLLTGADTDSTAAAIVAFCWPEPAAAALPSAG